MSYEAATGDDGDDDDDHDDSWLLVDHQQEDHMGG
jgi:hypothetical protein